MMSEQASTSKKVLPPLEKRAAAGGSPTRLRDGASSPAKDRDRAMLPEYLKGDPARRLASAYDASLARAAFDSTGRQYEAVLYTEAQPSLRAPGIEQLINEAVAAAVGMQGAATTANGGLSRLGLGRGDLESSGLQPPHVDRLYKLLYIHSTSLHDAVEEILRESSPATRPDLLRSTARCYQILLEQSFKTHFRSEYLELSAARNLQGAELLDKVEKLTEAHEDRAALERTIARLTTRHFEEAERRRECEVRIEALKQQLLREREEAQKLGAKYLREVEHRSSMQEEILQLRSRVQRLDQEAITLLTETHDLKDALDMERASNARCTERISELELSLDRQTALNKATEEKTFLLTKRTRDAEWEQEVTRQHYAREIDIRNELSAQLTAKIEEATKYKGLYQNVDDDLRKTLGQISLLESEIHGLKADAAAANQLAARMEESGNKVRLELDETYVKLERKRGKKRDYKRELDLLRDEHESVKASLERYIELSGQETTARVEAQRELRLWRTQAEALTTRFRATSVALSIAMRSYKCANTARQYLLREIEAARNDATNAQSSSQIKVKSALQQLANLEKQLQEARAAGQQSTERLDEELRGVRGRIAHVESERDALDAQVKDLTGRIEAATASGKASDTRVRQLDEELATARSLLTDSQALYKRTDQERQDLAAQVSRLREQVSDRDVSIQGLQADVHSKKEALAAVEANLHAVERALAAERLVVSDLREKLAASQSDAVGLTQQLAMAGTGNSELLGRLDEQRREIERLNQESESKSLEIGGLRERLHKSEAEVVVRQRLVDDGLRRLDDLQRGAELQRVRDAQKIEELESRLATEIPVLEQKLRDAQEDVEKGKEAFEQLKSRYVNFDEEQAKFLKAKEFLMREVDSLSYQVEQQKKVILSKDIEILKASSVSDTTGREAEEAYATRIKDKEGKMDQRVREIEAETRLRTADLLGRIAILETDLSDRNAKIKALEAAVAAGHGPPAALPAGGPTSPGPSKLDPGRRSLAERRVRAAGPGGEEPGEAEAEGDVAGAAKPDPTSPTAGGDPGISRPVSALPGDAPTPGKEARAALRRLETFKGIQARLDVRPDDIQMDYDRLRQLESDIEVLRRDMDRRDKIIHDLMEQRAAFQAVRFELKKEGVWRTHHDLELEHAGVVPITPANEEGRARLASRSPVPTGPAGPDPAGRPSAGGSPPAAPLTEGGATTRQLAPELEANLSAITEESSTALAMEASAAAAPSTTPPPG